MRTIVIALLGVGLLAAGCKDAGPNVDKTTDALAEEFTDGIEFEDETIEDSPPPESTADAPVIRVVDAPNAIAPQDLGVPDSMPYVEWFDVVLDTLSTPVDDGSVQAVLVHVVQADYADTSIRHRVIEPLTASGTQITLRAIVHRTDPFEGHAFTVRFALLMANGDVTPWSFWNLVIYPQDGHGEDRLMCACEEVVAYDDLLGYDLLESTNLSIPDTCTNSTMTSYFYGADGYDAGPCSYLMESYYYEGPIGEFLFPDQTRFPPNNSRDPDPWGCAIQISCQ